MRSAVLLSLPALFACSESLLTPPPERDALYFVLEYGPGGELLRPPSGPWSKATLPKRWAIEPDNRLRLVAVEESAVSAAYPSFRLDSVAETKLIEAPLELDGCETEGLLGSDGRVSVPLEALGDGVSVSSLGPGELAFGPEAPLMGFALEFEAWVCNQTHGPRLSAFGDENDPGAASMTSGVGTVKALDHISSSQLVLFGAQGISIVREDVGTAIAETVTFASLFAEYAGFFRLSSGVVAHRAARGEASTLIVAVSRSTETEEEDELGIARLSLTTDGLTLEAYEALGRAPSVNTWLRRIVVDARGRYLGLGDDWLVTSTSAAARPTRRALPQGFFGRSILVLSSEPPIHLVLGSRTLYKGNAFDALPAGPSLIGYARTDVAEAVTADFSMAPNRVPVIAFSDGRLRVEGADQQWVEYDFALPPEADACGRGRTRCGRSGALEESYLVYGQNSGGGLVVATSNCSAFFYRSPYDSCALGLTRNGYTHEGEARSSIAAITEAETQTFVVTQSREVFRLAVVVTNTGR